ncbi:helix-turn-helix domain-containing protein [Zunongwangia sp. HRR-M8]|uniref:helix-turn-helix domain-containing protein n=1 Tax=Zunongwangia sp. HRR-M8 TaxID=3015170 RepID=UPI0022DDCFB4|nr:helix-turn-helix domain-containing protein [Zunongwangia sp. HRR-M8]WBL21050.1 helix-turn-helix domain-containing protein [Zunongwangia sp. HRR-M8]
MKNSKLSERVTELRNRKGFSQEVLAEESGLSLRTIQRIENGETAPRGDTLQRIAKGLGVTSEDLIDWKLQKNDSYLAILNASALTFIFFPLLGILIPMLMWISKRKEIANVEKMGKLVLNFQISWFITYCVFFLIGVMSKIMHYSFANKALIFIGVLYVFNAILILFNVKRAKNGKNVNYFISIPFLR